MAKFTIEELLENIKASFTNAEGKSSLQISDRTIKETLEPFLSLVGDEVEMSDFIEKYAKNSIDSANRNLIKMNADFAKNYKPTTSPETKPTEFDLEGFFTRFAETQKTSIESALAPLRDKISSLESDKRELIKNESIASKKSELKLSKSWSVDFDNSVEIAKLRLGKDASADDIYNEAYKHFNQTLSSRGETYKPTDGNSSDQKPDFSDIKQMLESRKEK